MSSLTSSTLRFVGIGVDWLGLIVARSDKYFSIHLIVAYVDMNSLHLTHLFLLNQIDHRETTNCFISSVDRMFPMIIMASRKWAFLNFGSLSASVDFFHIFLVFGHVSKTCSTDSEARSQ